MEFFARLYQWRQPRVTVAQPEPLGLKPLYSTPNEQGNDLYTRQLRAAVADPGIHNIALTGNYGSGKSSILSDFVCSYPTREHKRRCIRISLSTLGSGAQSCQTSEELNNAIQKEIIKQLLFREAPQHMPNSKFKRIAAPDLVRVFLYATLVSIPIVGVIYYLFGNSILYKLAGTSFWWQIPLGVSLWLTTFSLAALGILALGHNFIVSKLSGGPLTLSLTDQNSYFDEYLDELIYFFQATSYEMVIFEDIERFEKTLIFRTLRQLNTLLNDSEQVRSKGKHIRFIYAIRDSLFAKGAAASVYEQGTDRAKFFDLIIPVVPFVTHQNSRDIFTRLLNTESGLGISKQLIDTIAPHITDMRLIKNIYNEYLVFAALVLGADKLEGLTEDKLFAMVVYKNTNLQDFELIKTGTSTLNDIYKDYRQTVTDMAADLSRHISANKAQLQTPTIWAARSAQYGQRLTIYAETTLSAFEYQPDPGSVGYTLQGVTYTPQEMQSTEFWNIIGTMGANETLNITYSTPQFRYQQSIRLDRQKIRQLVMADTLDIEQLEAIDADKLRQENAQLKKDLKGVRRKSIKELMDVSSEFSDSVTTHLAGGVYTDLVQDLLTADHIDAYFALYTSIFHGTSPKAANFLLHHLQLDRPDFFYEFKSEANIETLLNDGGGAYARSRALYNIDILNYLLAAAKPHGAEVKAHTLSHMLGNLAHGEPEDKEFLGAYLNAGQYSEKLLEQLSGRWSGIFDYLVLNTDIAEPQKALLCNAALKGSSASLQYGTSEEISTYINSYASEFPLLRSRDMPGDLGTTLARLGARFESFYRFSALAADMVIGSDLYVINRLNLEQAARTKNLSLTSILESSETVFDYVARNPEAYLSAVSESWRTDYTIDSPKTFVRIINHLAEYSSGSLQPIIEGASPKCTVEKLGDVATEAWSALLDTRAVQPTINNVLAYYLQDESGTIDKHLSSYLANIGQIEMNSLEDTEAVPKLAVAILTDTGITARVRSGLVHSLNLQNDLPAEAFPLQNGQLYGYLVRDDIIDDSAATYIYLKSTDPDTRFFYAANATNFEQYISEITLDSDEISFLAASERISPGVKRYLIANLSTFDPAPPLDALNNLADFAIANSMSLDVVTLYKLLGTIDAIKAVQLINLSGDSYTREGIKSLLELIGGTYEKLSQTGRHVTLDDTAYNTQLIERLQHLDMVSSVSPPNNNKLVVHRKKKW